MERKSVNLGCGPVFVDSAEWINLDFSPASTAVVKANLLDRLPLVDNSASVVYSSHFLEHVPRSAVPVFLRECFRILEPGGVVRLVLPDLENMVQEYLRRRNAGEHERADFVVLELIDQAVRRESGGQMATLYELLRQNPRNGNSDMVSYVRSRVGENLVDLELPKKRRLDLAQITRSKVWGRLELYWTRSLVRLLPSAFREQNVSFAQVGERHHWLWDFHQLTAALEEVGFIGVKRQSSDRSHISGFAFDPLDIDSEGMSRKGESSMYIEAFKTTDPVRP